MPNAENPSPMILGKPAQPTKVIIKNDRPSALGTSLFFIKLKLIKKSPASEIFFLDKGDRLVVSPLLKKRNRHVCPGGSLFKGHCYSWSSSQAERQDIQRWRCSFLLWRLSAATHRNNSLLHLAHPRQLLPHPQIFVRHFPPSLAITLTLQ